MSGDLSCAARDECGGAAVAEACHDEGEEAGHSLSSAYWVSGGGLDLRAAIEDQLGILGEQRQERVNVASLAGVEEAVQDLVALGEVGVGTRSFGVDALTGPAEELTA